MNVLPRRRPTTTADHDERYELDCAVRRLYAMVVDAVDVATATLLAGDAAAARSLARRDRMIDDAQRSLERRAVDRLARRAELHSREVRELLTVLRVVPDLERSGDLCADVAARARTDLGSRLPSEARVLVQQLGWHTTAMWRDAATAYVESDAMMVRELAAAAELLHELRGRLLDRAVLAGLTPVDAAELGVVAGCFGRLGDHAVDVTRRLADLTTPTAVAR